MQGEGCARWVVGVWCTRWVSGVGCTRWVVGVECTRCTLTQVGARGLPARPEVVSDRVWGGRFSLAGGLRGGVPREKKMLKGHLPRVIYDRVY